MITTWSILTTITISCLFIVIFCILAKNACNINIIGIPVLSLLLILIAIRLLIPIEIPYVHAFESTKILPELNNFLKYPLYKLNSKNVINLYTVLSAIWIFGALINTARLLYTYYKFYKSLLSSSINKSITKNLLCKINNEVKVPKNLRIIQSSNIPVPMLVGFFKPIIVFSSHNFSEQEEYFIIRHELQHYYNKDNFQKAFIEGLCILYWWNPLMHTLRNYVNEILEIKTDYYLTRIWNEYDRICYLKCLLETYKKALKRKYIMRPFVMEAVDFNNKSSFLKRFDIIINNKLNDSCIKYSIWGILSILLFISSFLIVIQPRYTLPDNYAYTTIDISPNTAYIVKNAEGGFDVYLHEMGYFTTLEKISDFYSELPIIIDKGDGKYEK